MPADTLQTLLELVDIKQRIVLLPRDTLEQRVLQRWCIWQWKDCMRLTLKKAGAH